ncbi:ADP catabolic process [Bonamia ostreae]|uniref:ADP catabolic process n=1 Tax=Bonamia ostreae TaxID=126728 RepID=A0ABV2AEI7_9EUKA
MIFRKNKLLGISDQLMFITSNEVFWNLARAFSNIGIVMLISKKRGDDMQVSFVSTFESMGYAYAGALGIILTDFLKVDGDARPCRFQNYWIMSLVGSCILPATTLLFMFWVIPRFKIPGDDGKEESEISRNSKSSANFLI